LAATLTRLIPQVFSGDPAWAHASLGDSGTAELSLGLDADGHVVDPSTTGRASSALLGSLDRALAVLHQRVFTAPSPRARFRITARVTLDDLHDGLHGDVFALSGGSFAGGVGTAFFALPGQGGPGRRVDVQIRVFQ
jgi:hypothetical protein